MRASSTAQRYAAGEAGLGAASAGVCADGGAGGAGPSSGKPVEAVTAVVAVSVLPGRGDQGGEAIQTNRQDRRFARL
jgi:hypothetical protein